jgi:hypothetical protein
MVRTMPNQKQVPRRNRAGNEMKNEAPEKLFESKVKQLALLNGWHCFHGSPHQVRPGVYRSDGKGYPDLTLSKASSASHAGGLIFAELKSAVGVISKEQREWLAALAPWAEVYLWRPADLSIIEARLSRRPA